MVRTSGLCGESSGPTSFLRPAERRSCCVEQTIVSWRLVCLATRKRQTTNYDGLPHVSEVPGIISNAGRQAPTRTRSIAQSGQARREERAAATRTVSVAIPLAAARGTAMETPAISAIASNPIPSASLEKVIPPGSVPKSMRTRSPV